MKINQRFAIRVTLVISLIISLTLASTHMRADTGTCSGQSITLPFTDVMGSQFFCQIAEAYFSGLANGTSLTTYSPTDNVTRDQMSAFITRTLDQSLQRGSRRAALRQWWTPHNGNNFAVTTVGNGPFFVETDGADLWVTNSFSNTVSRVRASDGSLLGTWSGAG